MATEEQSTKTESDVTSNLETPKNAVEKRALDCFRELERAERNFEAGLKFGQAMIDLHEDAKHGEWMDRLDRLGITYRKAQYWMAVVKDKPISRGKQKENAKPAFDWDAAADRLEKLRDDVYMLKQKKPQGSEVLFDPLASLSDVLGFELTKGGDNA
jgi:hypothetical protein